MSATEQLRIDLRELSLKLELLDDVQSHLEKCTDYRRLVQWKREKRECRGIIRKLWVKAGRAIRKVLDD